VSDVVYFQSEPRRTVSQALGRSEVKDPKCDPIETEAALQSLSSEVRTLILDALDAAHMTEDQAAREMGVSASLFSRQLQNLDNQHLSLQRLYRLPNSFWRELWMLVAERRKLARVRRRVVFEVLA